MGIHSAVHDLYSLTRTVVHSSDPRISLALTRVEPLAKRNVECAAAESSSFFQLLGDSLMRLRGMANPELRSSCIRSCTNYLYLTGRAKDAIPIANKGLELAKRTKNAQFERFCLTLLGILYGEIGLSTEALENYRASLELALSIGDRRGEYACWCNISALLLDIGMYTEAISAANRATLLQDANSLIEREMSAGKDTNLALAYQRLGETTVALKFALQSLANSPTPTNGQQAQGHIIRESNLVGILIDLGDFESAKNHANRARELAYAYPNIRSTTAATLCSALANICCGETVSSLEQLEATARDARVQESQPLLVDALTALVRAYQLIGQTENALNCLDSLMGQLVSKQASSLYDSLEMLCELIGVAKAPSKSLNLRQHQLHAARLRQALAEERLQDVQLEMLERLAVTADMRDDYSGEHGYRVGRLSALLAKEVGWSREQCADLDIAARLHDIGKFGIPERILFDDKTLLAAERKFIAAHTKAGAEMLSRSSIPQMRLAEDIAHFHHEWWDGTGYPTQRKGLSIPQGARIVAIADSFDAMTHGRPYAAALSIEEALGEISALRGRQFEPELADHFVALVRRLIKENENLDAYLSKAARKSPFLRARARIKELLAQESADAGVSSPHSTVGVTLN